MCLYIYNHLSSILSHLYLCISHNKIQQPSPETVSSLLLGFYITGLMFCFTFNLYQYAHPMTIYH